MRRAGLRCEIQQGLDGSGGLFAGAQLEDLSEQDQGGDDGSGLEVDIDGARVALEGGGEDPGRDGSR